MIQRLSLGKARLIIISDDADEDAGEDAKARIGPLEFDDSIMLFANHVPIELKQKYPELQSPEVFARIFRSFLSQEEQAVIWGNIGAGVPLQILDTAENDKKSVEQLVKFIQARARDHY